MEKQRINILFPGGFKPVHAGHLGYIDTYLKGDPEHTTQVYVIISNKDRDGITAQSSYDFLNKIFGRFPNFNCIITGYKSPVQAVYDMTATKLFGDGLYAMAASHKEGDVKRAWDYNKAFSKDGKYYTPGVKTLLLIPDGLPTYVNRNDEYNDSPISSTIVRQDILKDDYNAFLTAYETPYLPDYVNEPELQEYYNILKQEIKKPLHETAAAGRIDHPYDDNSLTFDDIKNMIESLFKGEITDITEKLDGINILASVDELGRTIFARNKTQLLNSPMLMNDVTNNMTWSEKTRKSFIKGAETIDKVFNNIKDKIDFFNYDDKADGVKYRNWISVEIIDHDNQNVIPYINNFVSFHNNIMTVCTKYYPEEDYEQTTFDDPNIETDTYKLEQAINKTMLTDDEFKASITPKMIFKDNGTANVMMNEHINDLMDLMEDYELGRFDTVGFYKYKAMFKYIINNKPIQHLTKEEMDELAKRWSGYAKVDLNYFKHLDQNLDKGSRQLQNKIIKDIRDYERTTLNKLQKHIMMPLDKLFINVGNDALKLFAGGTNTGNEAKVVNQIKKEITDAISNIQETGDEKALDKLEYQLFRLGDTVDVYASEGIVFKYHGRIYKLTGSFAVLNQIINTSRKIK
jgi:hypothetical protein